MSPYPIANMTDGPHSLKIRARDRAGNYSAETNVQWVIDTTAPVLALAANVGPFSNTTSASFTFSGTDGGAAITKFDCYFDNVLIPACASPVARSNLQDGSHTFRFIGYDAAGNASSPTSFSFVVDTVKPQVSISAVADATDQRSVTFQFSAGDYGSGVARTECSFNGATYTPCSSPVTYANLAIGLQTLGVRAFDLATNSNSTTASIDIVKSITVANTVSVTSTITFGRSVNTLLSGTQAIDISNRTNPTVTTYPNGIIPHALSVVSSQLAQSSSNFLELYSVPVTGVPTRTRSVSLTGFPSGTIPEFTRSVYVSGNTLIGCWADFATQSEMSRIGVWDISGTPRAIAEVFPLKGPALNSPYPDYISACTAEQDTVYIRRGRSTVAYPVSATGIGTPRIYDGAGTIFGDQIENGVLVGIEVGSVYKLNVFDTKLAGLDPISSITLPTSPSQATLKGGYLVLTLTSDGTNFQVRIYDLRVPSAPKLLALGSSPQFFYTAIEYPYIYGKGNTSLYILNVN
ncbi:MAG: hypothetical protein AAB250_18925 [Bdellovibrionota bacterium]